MVANYRVHPSVELIHGMQNIMSSIDPEIDFSPEFGRPTRYINVTQ